MEESPDLEDRYIIKDVQPDLEEGECLFGLRFAIFWKFPPDLEEGVHLGPLYFFFIFPFFLKAHLKVEIKSNNLIQRSVLFETWIKSLSL